MLISTLSHQFIVMRSDNVSLRECVCMRYFRRRRCAGGSFLCVCVRDVVCADAYFTTFRPSSPCWWTSLCSVFDSDVRTRLRRHAMRRFASRSSSCRPMRTLAVVPLRKSLGLLLRCELFIVFARLCMLHAARARTQDRCVCVSIPTFDGNGMRVHSLLAGVAARS